MKGYFQFVIFGGTGDLTHRKLMPAFYNLLQRDLLTTEFSIVAIGRRNDNRADYLAAIYDSLEANLDDLEQEVWQRLKESISYLKLDIKSKKSFLDLKGFLADLRPEQKIDNRIFYLATAPNFFGLITDKLAEFDLVDLVDQIQAKLVIEKPFGHDLKSAQRLNEQISAVFAEENIYRIDHYLGKAMMQNIMVLRFANIIFEPLWNKEYIDNIQIFSNETVGVVNRGEYYEESGVLKDMLQNHMMQILALVAMEEPKELTTKAIRDSKVEVLEELANLEQKEIADNIVRGQYDQGQIGTKEVNAYRDELGVASDSTTETFIALKLLLDNKRWSGVPFYLKTGKRLPEKLTQIVIEFKDDFHLGFSKDYQLASNLLVIKVQPEEGVYLQFNARELGSEDSIIPVKMDFCQNCAVGINSPKAYERLIQDMIAGEQTLFTRWDEVKYSWQFIDQIAEYWNDKEVDFPNYTAGSVGPQAALDLLKKDGRRWWDKN